MAELAFAAAASHAPGLVGLFDSAPEESREVVRSSYGRLAREIRAAELDVLLIVANDHLANSRIRAYPDFLIGMAAEHRGPHEWFKAWLGCRDYLVPGHRSVAEAMFAGMTRRGVRFFARHDNLVFDDNISIPVVLTDLDAADGPAMIPIMQNCTVPPMPDQRRSYAAGQALAESIAEDLPPDLRVGLLGSGGLSHEPGGARYFYIDEEFDHWFLDLLGEADHGRLLDDVTIARMDAAGVGGTTELLAWFTVLGAIGERPCETLGYTAYPDWKCGVGAVMWDVGGGR
jgi:hypothetical protein